MPPRRAPKDRPPTLKEARRAYLKRGGSSYMPEEERQRLIRAQEREERRVEKLKREAARQEAAKKRAEMAAKQRDERRRLGLPDPGVKIAQGQLRIGGFFLKTPGKEGAERYEAEGEKLEDAEINGREEMEVNEAEDDKEDQGGSAEEDLEGLQEDEEEYGFDIDDSDVLALAIAQANAPRPPETPEKSRPATRAAELRSSFFESNSQIDREVNEAASTSPIERNTAEYTPQAPKVEDPATPKAIAAEHLPPVKTPDRSEIESLLFAIPSQELEYLSSSPPRTTR